MSVPVVKMIRYRYVGYQKHIVNITSWNATVILKLPNGPCYQRNRDRTTSTAIVDPGTITRSTPVPIISICCVRNSRTRSKFSVNAMQTVQRIIIAGQSLPREIASAWSRSMAIICAVLLQRVGIGRYPTQYQIRRLYKTTIRTSELQCFRTQCSHQ